LFKNQQVIDQLLRERAPWFTENNLVSKLVSKIFKIFLKYNLTIEQANELEKLDGLSIMEKMSKTYIKHLEVSGIKNLSSYGSAIIVSNHPTGIADALCLWSALSTHRSDIFFFANRDILRLFPQLREVVAPVEWQKQKKSIQASKETLKYTKRAFKKNRVSIVFPSGRLAARKWFQLHERPWLHSAVKLSKKYKVPIIPIHISARNSSFYYLCDLINHQLRDIMLFHEVINKKKQLFKIDIGSPINWDALPTDNQKATEFIFSKTIFETNENKKNHFFNLAQYPYKIKFSYFELSKRIFGR
jgi:putative hemolysin|tara:strand:- start:525 stop:1430 length:906 start_codon:yes stop_codon:yes gene_type:complete